MPQTHEFRNVAIIAHVDHGKTTLVDALLQQSGAFSEHHNVAERVMDSGDLEREKGITILAKNTAVHRPGQAKNGGDLVLNIIDTPGHADFGGEVERGLSMVDGVILLVDASEGPLPQTRFVLRKALEACLPVIIVVNKTDRPDARIPEVVEECQDLLLDLASELSSEEAIAAAEAILDTPIVYASGRAGVASLDMPPNGELPDSDNLECLFDLITKIIPEPTGDVDAPLQAHVTNLDASSFLGRIGLVRIHHGTLRKGQQVAWIHQGDDGEQKVQQVKITELLKTFGVERKPAEYAVAGDIVAIAGIPDLMIGDTLAAPDNPVALPTIHVDEPAISMTIGVNTSPMAGRNGGTKLTARLVKDRLDRELVGNVSLRVLPTELPDSWEVQGRGEMALSVLVETMRREGFELTVGKPNVVTKKIDGKVHEPYENTTIDVPEEHLGAVTQLMAARKGQLDKMSNHGTGWVRMEYTIPARGLIGFRTIFLTETRGTGIANSVSAGYKLWAGDIRGRNSGSLVADRTGNVTAYALLQLADRGEFFVTPGDEVYEGVVVGENPRPEDMDVNITKEKKLTNMRAASADTTEVLQKARTLTLEEAMEFCSNDECVEVAPEAIRVRKVLLSAAARGRARGHLKHMH